jgi:hypothetical protein
MEPEPTSEESYILEERWIVLFVVVVCPGLVKQNPDIIY